MTVAPRRPYPDTAIKDPRYLHSLLSEYKNHRAVDREEPIVSYCQKIAPVDPLEILAAIGPDYPDYFYWENRREGTAILSYGKVLSIYFNDKNRFGESKKFLDSCFKRIKKIDNYNNINLKIFNSFTFFNGGSSSPFPPASLTIPRFQIIKNQNEHYLITNFLIDDNLRIEPSIEEIIKNLKTLQYHPKKLLNFSDKYRSRERSTYDTRPIYNFKTAVAGALKSIEKNYFSKIVLAHALDVVSPVAFGIVHSLDNLRRNYPDCYVFCLGNGEGDHFLGASPERLLSLKNNYLVGDALAGSAPRGKTPEEDRLLGERLLNNEKEKREHRAVSDYITEKLRELGLEPSDSGRELLKLSNIQHLWTRIGAALPFPVHPLEIVSRLHPTPAVAGVPTEIVLEEIRKYESFDRSLYAAPLGWVDGAGNSEFVVGIRSALIRGNHARLYAGAGIVAGSAPEKEGAEILLKFQPLLGALR